MSLRSEYTFPFPDAVEVMECSQQELQEWLHNGHQDTCFLIQENHDEGSDWHSSVGYTRSLKEQACVFDADLLGELGFGRKKRFHILPPPVPVQPEPVESTQPVNDSPGAILFHSLASNCTLAVPDRRKVMGDHMKLLEQRAAQLLADKNNCLLIATEVLCGINKVMLTPSEADAITVILSNANARWSVVQSVPANPVTALIKNQVQNRIGTRDTQPAPFTF